MLKLCVCKAAHSQRLQLPRFECGKHTHACLDNAAVVPWQHCACVNCSVRSPDIKTQLAVILGKVRPVLTELCLTLQGVLAASRNVTCRRSCWLLEKQPAMWIPAHSIHKITLTIPHFILKRYVLTQKWAVA